MRKTNYHSNALHGVAVTCALVTSISVAITVFDLFGGGGIGMLFAIGASALDLYKVLAFSTVVCLITSSRYATGIAALIVAIALGFFSAWATSEFLSTAIISKRQHAEALHTQRAGDIKSAQASDAARIIALDKAESDIRAQIAAMRARGQVTKAAEVESNELPKIAAEREAIRKRIDENSRALTDISAEIPKGFALSTDAILGIARGFASFLEIVPAVVMAVTAKSQQIPANPDTFAHEEDAPPPRARTIIEDSEILDDLRSVRGGTVISMTEYARSKGIGQTRAVRIFSVAVENGILERTAGRGYRRAAPRLKIA